VIDAHPAAADEARILAAVSTLQTALQGRPKLQPHVEDGSYVLKPAVGACAQGLKTRRSRQHRWQQQGPHHPRQHQQHYKQQQQQ
jgi:hypothetical protein